MIRGTLCYFVLYRTLLPIIYNTVFRGVINGAQNVPEEGPILIVSNHSSYIDTPILGYAIGRPVVFLAKEQLFSTPIISVLLRLTRCIRVSKGEITIKLIREVEERLSAGYAVAIYPEGTRTKSQQIKKISLGASYISAISQTRVLPVALVGTGKVLPKGSIIPKYQRLEVRIGRMIEPPSSRQRIDLIKHGALIKASINALLNAG